MEKRLLLMVISMMACISCVHETQETIITSDALFCILLEQSFQNDHLFSKEKENRIVPQTKGFHVESMSFPSEYEWMERYLKKYMEPEDIRDWDEKGTLNAAIQDKSLTNKQRILLAKAMAWGYNVKTFSYRYFTSTKTSVECVEACQGAYARKCGRIARLAGLTGAICVMLGQPEGAALATIAAYYAVEQAADDMDQCIGGC